MLARLVRELRRERDAVDRDGVDRRRALLGRERVADDLDRPPE
ncbi:MAG: hypothetical protein ACYS8X_02190 [Planctomycetota bacterium]